eukprot:PhF_6_TR35400/c0_g1_i2/m.51491
MSTRGGPRSRCADALCSIGFREFTFSLIPLFFLVLAAVFMYDWQEVSKEYTSRIIMQHAVSSLRDNVKAYFDEKTRFAGYLQTLVQAGVWTDPSDLKQYTKHVVPVVAKHDSYKAVDAAVDSVFDVSVKKVPTIFGSNWISTDVDRRVHLAFPQGYYSRIHNIDVAAQIAFERVTVTQMLPSTFDASKVSWITNMNIPEFTDDMHDWTMPFLGEDGERRLIMSFRQRWPFSHFDDQSINNRPVTFYGVQYRLQTLRNIIGDLPENVHAAVFNKYTGRIVMYNKRIDVDTVTLWNVHEYFSRAADVASFFADPNTNTAMIMYQDVRLQVSSLMFEYDDNVNINYNSNWMIITAAPDTWPNHKLVAHSITRFFQSQFELQRALQFLVTSRLFNDVQDIVNAEQIVLPILVTNTAVESVTMNTDKFTLRFFVTNKTQAVTEVHHNFNDNFVDPLFSRRYKIQGGSLGTPIPFEDWTDLGTTNFPVSMKSSVWYQQAALLKDWGLLWEGPWELYDEASNRYSNLYYHSISLVFRVSWDSGKIDYQGSDVPEVKFRFEFTVQDLVAVLDRLDIGVTGAAAVVTGNGQVVAINSLGNRPYLMVFPPVPLWLIPEYKGLSRSQFASLLFQVPCATCTLLNETNRGYAIDNSRRVFAITVTDTFWMFVSLSDDVLTTTELSDKVTMGGLVFFVFILMIINGIFFVYNVRNVVLMDLHLLHLARHNPSGVRGLEANNLSSNNEIRRMERAILKMKDALSVYLSYLPQHDVEVETDAEGAGLVSGRGDSTDMKNIMADDGDEPKKERKYSVATLARSLEICVQPVKIIFTTITIHGLQHFINKPAFDVFFKKVCDFICPAIKLSGGQITGFHFGVITAIWDVDKVSETLTRNVFSQCVGSLMSLQFDYHAEKLQREIERLGFGGTSLNIIATSAEAKAGNIGTEDTKSFSIFGRVRFEADNMTSFAQGMQQRHGVASITLIDEVCQKNVSGRLLCREVLPGKLWNPFTYDPSVFRSENEDTRIAKYEAYKKYFNQRVTNGPLATESDFRVLAEAHEVDPITRRLVMIYNDPVAYKVSSV